MYTYGREISLIVVPHRFPYVKYSYVRQVHAKEKWVG